MRRDSSPKEAGNPSEAAGVWWFDIGAYKHNSKQVPEPDEEPELFTQADTAW